MRAQSGFDIDYGSPTGKISGRLAQALILRRPLDRHNTLVAIDGDTLRVSLRGGLIARLVGNELLYVTFGSHNTNLTLSRLNAILDTLTKNWRARLFHATGVFVDKEHNNRVTGSVYIDLTTGCQVTPKGLALSSGLIKELDITNQTIVSSR